MGAQIAKFWSGNYSFTVLHDVAPRIAESNASSSLMERVFSRIGRYCTKERNSLMSKNLSVFLQVNDFQKFQHVMKEIFAVEGLRYDNLELLNGTTLEKLQDAEKE